MKYFAVFFCCSSYKHDNQTAGSQTAANHANQSAAFRDILSAQCPCDEATQQSVNREQERRQQMKTVKKVKNK